MNSEDIKKFTIDKVLEHIRDGGPHSPESRLGKMELRRRELVYQRKSVIWTAAISALAGLFGALLPTLVRLLTGTIQ